MRLHSFNKSSRIFQFQFEILAAAGPCQSSPIDAMRVARCSIASAKSSQPRGHIAQALPCDPRALSHAKSRENVTRETGGPMMCCQRKSACKVLSGHPPATREPCDITCEEQLQHGKQRIPAQKPTARVDFAEPANCAPTLTTCSSSYWRKATMNTCRKKLK